METVLERGWGCPNCLKQLRMEKKLKELENQVKNLSNKNKR